MQGVSGQNMVLSVMEGKISLQKLSCRFGRGNDAVIQTECMTETTNEVCLWSNSA